MRKIFISNRTFLCSDNGSIFLIGNLVSPECFSLSLGSFEDKNFIPGSIKSKFFDGRSGLRQAKTQLLSQETRNSQFGTYGHLILTPSL